MKNSAPHPFTMPELCFLDEHGRRILPADDPLFEGIPAQFAEEGTEYSELIDSVRMKKPKWFKSAETEAGEFLGSLALQPTGPLILLKEGPAVEELGFTDKSTIALHYPNIGVMLFRHKNIKKVFDKCGPNEVGGIIAHEMTHDLAPREAMLFRKVNENDFIMSQRTGLVVKTGEDERNAFLEEGLAEFLGAWFKRAKTGNAGTLSFVGTPKNELPKHYQHPKPIKVTGPDGYAIEVLAWAARKRKVMRATEFISCLLETRRPETLTSALRDVAKTINGIEPGLYPQLQKLPYGRKSWQRGLGLVYKAATGRDWYEGSATN